MDRSSNARSEQARQHAKVSTMQEIYRQGGYDLDDRQRTTAQEVEAAGSFVVEESKKAAKRAAVARWISSAIGLPRTNSTSRATARPTWPPSSARPPNKKWPNAI